MFTAWGGRITLDDADISFDKDMAKNFVGAGFTVAVGGTVGRRLQGQHSVGGFFRHVENAGSSWDCQDIPLPTLPDVFKHTMIHYHPCQYVAEGVVEISECHSSYGGLTPGAGVLPAKHALATVSKAERFMIQAGRIDNEDSVLQQLFYRVDTIRLRSTSWEVQRDSNMNHPGQECVTPWPQPGPTGPLGPPDPNQAPCSRGKNVVFQKVKKLLVCSTFRICRIESIHFVQKQWFGVGKLAAHPSYQFQVWGGGFVLYFICLM